VSVPVVIVDELLRGDTQAKRKSGKISRAMLLLVGVLVESEGMDSWQAWPDARFRKDFCMETEAWAKQSYRLFMTTRKLKLERTRQPALS
jgi:hypothetical protein